MLLYNIHFAIFPQMQQAKIYHNYNIYHNLNKLHFAAFKLKLLHSFELILLGAL